MSFEWEDSEIYFIIEYIATEDQHRKLKWRPSWYADDPQANEEWAASNQEVGADKELKRTLKVKTKRQ